MVKKPAIFIDRDGVINKKMPENDYVKDWKEFVFLKGVLQAFKLLEKTEFLIIIITNQRCIARKIITAKKLKAIHRKMVKEINKHKGRVDAIYVCPHHKNACQCRKPKPGMILQAINDFKKKGIGIDIKKSYLIDDNHKDIAMGKYFDLKTIKIGKPISSSLFTAENLLGAINILYETYHKKSTLK